MADMRELLNVKQHVEGYAARLSKDFIIEGGVFFPESPNPKLQIQIKYGESIILEMSYWQNDQCRYEAVDLDRTVLLFEDEISIKENMSAGEFLCSKVDDFNAYVLTFQRSQEDEMI